MDKERYKEYRAEIENALTQLANHLAESQKIMGVLESFLHLALKEWEKPEPKGE